jgi:hypothetical protein
VRACEQQQFGVCVSWPTHRQAVALREMTLAESLEPPSHLQMAVAAAFFVAAAAPGRRRLLKI